MDVIDIVSSDDERLCRRLYYPLWLYITSRYTELYIVYIRSSGRKFHWYNHLSLSRRLWAVLRFILSRAATLHSIDAIRPTSIHRCVGEDRLSSGAAHEASQQQLLCYILSFFFLSFPSTSIVELLLSITSYSFSFFFFLSPLFLLPPSSLWCSVRLGCSTSRWRNKMDDIKSCCCTRRPWRFRRAHTQKWPYTAAAALHMKEDYRTCDGCSTKLQKRPREKKKQQNKNRGAEQKSSAFSRRSTVHIWYSNLFSREGRDIFM